jgi:hypothetical protein
MISKMFVIFHMCCPKLHTILFTVQSVKLEKISMSSTRVEKNKILILENNKNIKLVAPDDRLAFSATLIFLLC